MIFLGDSKQIPLADESVDLVVTDPPYGLKFMGKNWDKAVPPSEAWKEVLRVLKPGAFAFVHCSPRQDLLARMIIHLEDAGFKTGFTSLYHVYASGFPKGQNLSKAADKKSGAKRKITGLKKKPGKRKTYAQDKWTINNQDTIGLYETTPATPEAKKLQGAFAGYQPKPALELILVAMKPLSKKTYLDQALENGKGCTWLDDCRIPTKKADQAAMERANTPNSGQFKEDRLKFGDCTRKIRSAGKYNSSLGRYPANLLVSNDALNDGTNHKSGSMVIDKRGETSIFGCGTAKNKAGYKAQANNGSFSRYFDLDAWAKARLPEQAQKTWPYLIVPKASPREKNEGVTGPQKSKPTLGEFGDNPGRKTPKTSDTPRANHHPTVKPVKLAAYLIALGSKRGDVILDPFAGSGTTGVAAEILGRYFIGVELNREYAEIARDRESHARASGKTQLDLFGV